MSNRASVVTPVQDGGRVRLSAQSMMKQELSDFARQVNSYLEEFWQRQLAEAPAVQGEAQHMIERLREFSRHGGKRLRPYLVAQGAELLAQRKLSDEIVLKTALLPELLHTFLLVHDDVMDQSETRRGAPTVHIQYAKERVGGEQEEAQRFGESMAILAGDLAFTLAGKLVTELDVAPEKQQRLLKLLNDAAAQTIYGQELDLRLELAEDVSVEDVVRMYELKTAYYSFEVPLRMGAVLADASDSDMVSLSQYGRSCGIAFQVVDDILGLFGDEATIGKSAKSDLIQGKRTILLVKAWESEEGQDLLSSVAQDSVVSDTLVEEVRQLVKDSGALDYAENLALEHVTMAKRSLETFDDARYSEEAREKLSQLADFVTKRDS